MRSKIWSVGCVAILSLLFTGAPALLAGLTTLDIAAAIARPAGESKAFYLPSISGFADEGTFRFYLNEEAIITQSFNWKQDGSYQGEYTLSMAGQTAESMPFLVDILRLPSRFTPPWLVRTFRVPDGACTNACIQRPS